MRVTFGVALVLSLGCGGLAGTSGDVSIPPIGTPPVPVPTVAAGPDCVSFCQQTATCWTQEGKPIGPDESDCQTSCKPGGSYSHMGPASFACATVACGQAFDDCSGNGMMAVLQAGMAGAPMDAPAKWPASFPYFSGGTPYDPGPVGPVQANALLFGAMPPADLAKVVKAEAVRYGWTVASEESGAEEDGARYRAGFQKDGHEVDTTTYSVEGTTVVLVMW